MKIIKKRILAGFLDAFIICFLTVALAKLLESWNIDKNIPLAVLILFIPYIMRDVVFRNASIGKRMLGISVYTTDWEKPGFLHLMKRSLFMSGRGCHLRSMLVDGYIINLLDYERDKFNSYVIDNKVYRKLSERSVDLGGDFSENMSRLYDEYLRNLYVK